MYPGSLTQQIIYGAAHTVDPDTLDSLLQGRDPTLLQRKGRLVPLCDPDLDRAVFETLFRAYYDNASFDILPCLREALSATYIAHPAARQGLPMVLAYTGLYLYAVGTADAVVYLIHLDDARPLFAPNEPGNRLHATPFEGPDGASWTFYSLEWRLAPSDLVLAVRPAPGRAPVEAADLRALARLSRGSRNANALAAALSRAARASRGFGRHADRPPTIVLGIPGFGPVPPFQSRHNDASFGAPPPPEPRKPRPVRGYRSRPPGQRSPIWAALLIAVLAVGLTLWLKPPDISSGDIHTLINWALTPPAKPTGDVTGTPAAGETPVSDEPAIVDGDGTPAVADGTPDDPSPTATAGNPAAIPTATPHDQVVVPTVVPSPTPRPTRYAEPVLASPLEGDNVHGAILTLRWTWNGVLGPDDYYDVRLWRLGAPESSIAWTRDTFYVQRLPDTGWQNWTVVVIRGRDGVVEQELSPEPTPVRFHWRPDGSDSSDDSTGAPTRVAPDTLPTRVAPAVTPRTGQDEP